MNDVNKKKIVSNLIHVDEGLNIVLNLMLDKSYSCEEWDIFYEIISSIESNLDVIKSNIPENIWKVIKEKY